MSTVSLHGNRGGSWVAIVTLAACCAVQAAGQLGLCDSVNKSAHRYPVYGGAQWEFYKSYDCFGGDLLNLHAVPMFAPHFVETLKACANACLDHGECIGFNYPKGDMGPARQRKCFLKNKGDESHEKAIQCDNGRPTEFYNYYTLVDRDCGKKVRLRKPIAQQAAIIGAPFSFTVPDSTFYNDAQLKLTAAQVDGGPLPAWLSFDPETLTFSGTPDASAQPVKIRVTTAADGYGHASSTEFQIGVSTGQQHFLTAPSLPHQPQYLCYHQNVMYEPLDMNYSQTGRHADSVVDCQRKCRATVSCGFFTWYPPAKICHFALPTALKQTGRLGFIGGPADCDPAKQRGSPNTIDTLWEKQTCLLRNVSYFPKISKERPTTYVDNPLACQKQCADTSWCAHFIYNELLKSCDLTAAYAEVTSTAVVYEITGPPSCNPIITFSAVVTSATHEFELLGNELRDHDQHAVMLLEAAIVKYIGNFTPYEGPHAGTSRPLLLTSNIDTRVGHGNDDGSITLHVRIRTTDAHAMYIRQLFRQARTVAEMQRTMTAAANPYGPQYNPALRQMRITLERIYNFHFETNAGNYQSKQLAQLKHPEDYRNYNDAAIGSISGSRAVLTLGGTVVTLAVTVGFLTVCFAVLPRAWQERLRAWRTCFQDDEDDLEAVPVSAFHCFARHSRARYEEEEPGWDGIADLCQVPQTTAGSRDGEVPMEHRPLVEEPHASYMEEHELTL